MLKHNEHGEMRHIPFLLEKFYICYDGTILNEICKQISLEEFNNLTCLNVTDVKVIAAIVFQEVYLQPAYWSKISIENEVGNIYPENFVLSYKEPISSLEYPGFFIIPYYSNYVISRSGILIKKSNGLEIQASRTSLGYFTFRMTDDFGKTQNFLRHRILAYAFLTIPYNYEKLDINHIDGIPGNDSLDNIEWATRSENNYHAVNNGLKTDNKQVEVYDRVTDKSYMFNSCSQAGKFFKTTETTISNRASSNGTKIYNGFQFRFFKEVNEDWPVVNNGDFTLNFSDGKIKTCDSLEAARTLDITRTSLMRILREGRNTSKNGVYVQRIK